MSDDMENTLNPPEKTVEELEAEARARITAERQKETPKEEVKEGQPEINALKKRSKNRVFTLIIALLGALILLAYLGDKVYSHFAKEAPKQEEEIKTPVLGSMTVRKNLGQDVNPYASPATPPAQQNISDNAQAASPPPQPVTFNKSMALSLPSSTAANTSTGGAQGMKTRKDELTGSGSAVETQLAADKQAAADRMAAAQALANGQPVEDPTLPSQVAVSKITLNPSLYIPVDTYIPCSLKTRFVSDVAGRISCIISDDVFSADHHVRLIPAGTLARGSYKSGTLKHGQARMFIVWTELRTPTGLKIPMVDSQVVGQLGEAGIDGWIDSHFWERFGNAMLLSTVQDVAAAAAGASPSKDRNTDYTENSRAAASEMAKSALDNSINIPPTIYKNQGDVIGIMTGTDIDFSNVYQLSLKK